MHRLPTLDCLRALAVGLVLFAHFPSRDLMAGPAERAMVACGWFGVDLFFVLSGFLIGGLFFQARKAGRPLDAQRFWVRRAFKIVPPYAFYLVVLTGVWVGTHGVARSAEMLWPYFVHVQNYVPVVAWSRMLPIHLWSLAVEEHFYLALPPLLLLLDRRKGTAPYGALPLAFGAIAAACLAARAIEFAVEAAPDMIFHFKTHLRADTLMAGVMLRWLAEFSPRFVEAARRFRSLLPVPFVAAMIPAYAWQLDHSWYHRTVGYSVVWLASACLVLWAWLADQKRSGGPNVAVRAIAAVGKWSYSIYLWHLPFAQQAALLPLERLIPAGPALFWSVLLAYVGLAVGLGWLTTLLIERPALGLRDRWFPSRQREAQNQRAGDH